MIRGLLAEFGIEMARGLRHALELAARLSAGDAAEVPSLAQRVVTGLADQIGAVQIQLTRLEKELLAWHRDSDLSQRLATIPGVGIVSATALAASVSEPERFRSGRQFAASLGLTPLQNCSGGKEPGQDLAHGRPLPAPPARSRHDLSDPTREGDADLGRSAAAGTAPAQAGACGDRCGGQSHGSGRLGDHDPRRHLLRTGGRGRLTARQGDLSRLRGR